MARSERRLDAAPSEVFDLLIDAERYPQWLVGARNVVVNDAAWPAPGSSFDHEVGGGPVQVHDSTTVTANEPDRRFDLVVRARPFLEADVHFGVQRDGEGTVLVMDEVPRGPFKLLAPLIAPLAKLRNDRSLGNLAALLARRSGPDRMS